MKNKKTIYVLLILFFILTSTIIAGYCLLFNHPFQIEKRTYLYIDEDDNIDSVYTKIENRLHTSTLRGFRLLSSLSGYAEQIHPGAYQIDASYTTWKTFHRLQQGMQTPVRLTIPSVRTLDKLVKTVSRQIMADSASLSGLLNDSTFCAHLGYNSNTLPALFIPDTYEVYWTITPEQFVERMQKEHKRFWNEERIKKAQHIGFTPVEIVTLASIVEEETIKKAEKPMVAGLYINRLHKGMPLQADPTVKFALQDFTLKRIRHKHLECDSPYNTYKYPGLPPGPIRIPSIDGIESVLNYTRHDYLYMCAKEDFSGYHNFAENMTKHLQNAARYQRELNKRNIH